MFLIAEADMSLQEAVVRMAPTSSKTSCRSWIKEGRIQVDGRVVRVGTTPVKRGQRVELGSKARFVPKSELPIVYEDPYLIVIDKPEGLLSVSTAFETEKTAHSILKDHFRPKRVFVVHRLDQETSGLMLFALDETTRDKLKAGFAEHSINRRYTALVDGVVEDSGSWTSYQYEDKSYFVHNTDDPERGSLAVTHYKVMGHSKTTSWLELELDTGRKNQIRAHCQMAGHSVIGDSKYGSTRNPLRRMALHARELRFVHPITGKNMKFNSPVPESFKRMVKVREAKRA